MSLSQKETGKSSSLLYASLLALSISIGCNNCTKPQLIPFDRDKKKPIETILKEAQEDTAILQMKDIIDVLAEYEIEHYWMQGWKIHPEDTLAMYLLGITQFDRQKIMINDVVDVNYRKFFIFH